MPQPYGMGLTDWIPGRRPRRVTGFQSFVQAFLEAWGNLDRWLKQTVSITASIAIGVGLAITISATARGIDRDVRRALPRDADVETITQMVAQGGLLITILTIFVSTAFAGLVATMSLDKRRREIGVKRQYGLRSEEIMVEGFVEAFFLSLIGGVIGVLLGVTLSLLMPTTEWFSALVPDVNARDVGAILFGTCVINWLTIGAVVDRFSARPSADQDL